MGLAPGSDSSQQTPNDAKDHPRARRVRWIALTALTGINLLNYIDRNIYSALLEPIKADLKFTDTELGILGSAFIFTYTFASPLFGLLGDRGRRSRIMSFGVSIWSVATAFSGVFTSFVGQFATRASVGFGESAYSVIAPSSIADYFPKRLRGRMFAIYSGAIPIGSALGYVIGGLLEPIVGWRHAFFVVGVPGLLLAAILFFLPDPKRGASETLHDMEADKLRSSSEERAQSVGQVYKSLFQNGGFLYTVLGYAAYTFVVGGMAFWMPSYLMRYFSVSVKDANVQFGAMTVVGGFVGTLIGGTTADWIEKRSGNGYLKVSFASMLIAAPLFWLVLQINHYFAFMATLFVLEIFLFLCMSPLDAAVISYVRPAQRATAMALNVFLIHALGDGISRMLMGYISEGSELRSAILMLPYVLVLAGILWAVGFIFYWQPMAWPKGALKLPRWQAHRGYRAEGSGVVENTLEAFRRARDAGAVMTECDVHLSKDGQVVVFHDYDLKRLAGRNERVEDLTAKELAQYANAPRLIELLTDPLSPKMINIEIKGGGFWRGRGLESAIAKVISEARAEDRVLVSSFNPLALRRFSKLAPLIPRALLVSEEIDPSNKIYLRKMWLGCWARPHMLNIDQDMLTGVRVDRWLNRGIRVVAWTVNDAGRARALLQIGAAGAISDQIFTDQAAGLSS